MKEAPVKPTLATLAVLAFSTLLPLAAAASGDRGFGLDVIVDGAPRPEYAARGTFYVEALRGREYVLRLTNPLPYRVAVALSVDGLNSIDAKHTDAWSASKWVLGPYESVEIPGWQVNGSTARRFTFTSEKRSYGAWLGKTQDLGVIEAVFYKEKVREPIRRYYEPKDERGPMGAPIPNAVPEEGTRDGREGAAAQAPSAPRAEKARPQLSDDYAATGMGDRTSHEVFDVAIDVVREPVARVRIRYEYRPELVKLGVLPREIEPYPLDRREHARGFESYCPEPR
jgi:hypothetical protein